jgi:pimeloyl-ACP methyl ester carboxylesterase
MTDALPPAARQLLAQAQEHVTVHAGARTVWHRWGDRSSEPVVLLHGGSGSWTHWLLNIEALVQAGRQVLAPDMPGFGDSDKPPGARDADDLVAPLASGLAQLLDARDFDLVGFSFGGLVGGLMASSGPAPRRLVIVGAPLLGVGVRPVRLREWRHLDAQAAIEVHRSNLAALMVHRPQAVTPLAIALHQAHVPLDRLRRRAMARTDTLARTLTTVTCPVVAIYGQHDVLYRDQLEAVEATLDALPTLRGRTAIPDAGHWVQFEAPQAFDLALARALA